MAVSGIEGDSHIGEDRTGKLAAELGDQNGLEKRSFINPIPTGRIGRPVDDGSFGFRLHEGTGRGHTGRRRRGLPGSGPFPVVEFGEQLEKLTGRRNGAFGCDTGRGGQGSLGGLNEIRKCAGEPGQGFHPRSTTPARCLLGIGVSVGQHERFGAQGAPPAFYFLEPQCLQQDRLGLGARGLAAEGDWLIVGKQARFGVLSLERPDARAQQGCIRFLFAL